MTQMTEAPTPSSVLRMKFRTLRLSQVGAVLRVEVHHPDNKYNFIDLELMEEFAALVSELRRERNARAVLLTGSRGFFSGGGHFAVMEMKRDPVMSRRISQTARQLINDYLQIPIPIVCALNGPALGFGATWALLSDVTFAGEDVTLSDPHVLRGLGVPDGAALWTLAMGPVRAKRFLMTGEDLTARQAVELGLLTFVSDPSNTEADAAAFAAKLAAGAPSAISHTKLLCNVHIRQALDLTLDTGAAWESLDFRTDDHLEALASFREGREPRFTGQ
jgi:enoyl-CoA hydratase